MDMDQDFELFDFDDDDEDEEPLPLLLLDRLHAIVAALNNDLLPPPQPNPNPNPQGPARVEENPIIEPGTPNFVITTPPPRATVTLNFVKNTVSLNGSTRTWALTNLSTIIGDNNKVRVITTAAMPVEVIPGPPGFSILPPQLDPGTKYVILKGVRNRWRIIQE